MTKDRFTYSTALPSGGVVLVEPMSSFDNFVNFAIQSDHDFVQDSSQKRKIEQLMWRSMARCYFHNLNIILSYNEVGAPQVLVEGESNMSHISVSHSSSHVALIISPSLCSIDIEQLNRDFMRVASRYISPCEQQLISEPHDSALLWSAKETLYKFAGRKQLNLLDDIRVTRLDSDLFEGSIAPHTCTIRGVATTIFDHSLVFVG